MKTFLIALCVFCAMAGIVFGLAGLHGPAVMLGTLGGLAGLSSLLVRP